MNKDQIEIISGILNDEYYLCLEMVGNSDFKLSKGSIELEGSFYKYNLYKYKKFNGTGYSSPFSSLMGEIATEATYYSRVRVPNQDILETKPMIGISVNHKEIVNFKASELESMIEDIPFLIYSNTSALFVEVTEEVHREFVESLSDEEFNLLASVDDSWETLSEGLEEE